mgnify:CR=1 FL=1
MTKNLPVPTADEINKAHEFARESAGMAVEWAVKCGQLLTAKKEILPRGEFDGWVRENCQFGRSSAYAYMKVADKSSRGLDDLRTIQQALGYDKPKPKPNTPKEAVSVVNPPGDGQDGTEETGADRPAASATRPPPGRGAPPLGAAIEDEPERPDDVDEDAALEAAEREYMASAEKALGTDAMTEIKRLTDELAAVKLSRDGYMDGKASITKLLKAEQRKTERLTKRITELEKENESLRSRIASMEEAA